MVRTSEVGALEALSHEVTHLTPYRELKLPVTYEISSEILRKKLAQTIISLLENHSEDEEKALENEALRSDLDEALSRVDEPSLMLQAHVEQVTY